MADEEFTGADHIDRQGRLHVYVTCFFDKAPERQGWRPVWSETTTDKKWVREYIYKKEIDAITLPDGK